MHNTWTVRADMQQGGAVSAAVPGALGWLDHCTALFGMPPGRRQLVIGTDAAPGWVRGDTIHLGGTVLEAAGCGELAAALLLAHEAAHLAQAAIMAPPASAAACEAEAGYAAASALTGRRFICKQAAPADRRQHWGLVGHYYTVYYMSLACGATADEAARMALYTQIPDLVAELDAVKCAIDYYLMDSRQKQVMSYKMAVETAVAEALVEVSGKVLQAGVIASSLVSPFGLPMTDALRLAGSLDHGTRRVTGIMADVGTAHMVAVLEAEAQMHVDLSVQRGLHALTGHPAVDERAFRRRILMDLPWGSKEFGLALHSFGDSYAHTQLSGSGRMYETGLGHALDLHAPDVVSKHAPTYREYCGALYDLLAQKGPRQAMPKAAALAFADALIKIGAQAESVAEAANRSLYLQQIAHGAFPIIVPMPRAGFQNPESREQTEQIATIKALAAAAPFNAPIAYSPPDEAVPWVEFRMSVRPRPRVWPNNDELGWMLAMAMRWAAAGG